MPGWSGRHEHKMRKLLMAAAALAALFALTSDADAVEMPVLLRRFWFYVSEHTYTG